MSPLAIFLQWLKTDAVLDQSATLSALWDKFNHDGIGGDPLDYKTVGVPRLVQLLQANGFPKIQPDDIATWKSLHDALVYLSA